MPKARLIYNPTSGHKPVTTSVVDILAVLEEAGFEASSFQTTEEKDSAKSEAIRVAKAGFDLIVSAGGDGTLDQIINGIAPLETRPKVAIVPAGTANDFARALHIPRNNFKAAAEVILKGQTQKLDIGHAYSKTHSQYFVNNAGGGHVTEVTYAPTWQQKSVFGYSAYLMHGVKLLAGLQPRKVRLTYDNGVFEGETVLFLLGLTNSIGGFEKILPVPEFSDGYFGLLIVKPTKIRRLLRLIKLAVDDCKHLADNDVIFVKTKTLQAELLDDNQHGNDVNIDGEKGTTFPLLFENLTQHIEFYVNF
ncbi:diacylglycerol kinase [Holzapfeliella sp. He02]|uniref:Diacylglycerol kinase n=1 Tax=Holzapfeliella saturejae TaxID=3082953 RepID=A0ABU8SH90_9LACO